MPPESRLRTAADWYVEALRCMGEEPLTALYSLGGYDALLRFSVIPSFESVKVLRVWKHGADARAVVKVSDGAGGYPPFKLKFERRRLLGPDEWRQCLAWLHDPDLWQPRPDVKTGPDGEEYVTFDGTSWLAESIHAGAVQAAADHGSLDESWKALAVWLRDQFRTFRSDG